MIVKLVYFLFGVGVFFSISVLLDCYPKIRLICSDIFRVFCFFAKWIKKANIESEFTGIIEILSKDFNKEIRENFLPKCKVKWVNKKNVDNYLNNKGDAIICINFTKNRDMNIFNALNNYVKISVLSTAKPFMEPYVNKAINYVTLRALLLKSNRKSLSIFNKYYTDEIDEVQDEFQKINSLYEIGYFKRILLPELSDWGERVSIEIPSDELKKESEEFINWLYEDTKIDTREDEQFNFIYERKNLKIAIILVAKEETYNNYGMEPYFKRANQYASRDFNSFYLLAIGETKGEIAKNLARELQETECYHKKTREISYYIIQDQKRIKHTCIGLTPDVTTIIQKAWERIESHFTKSEAFYVTIEEVVEKNVLVDAYGLKITMNSDELASFEIPDCRRYFHFDQDIKVFVKLFNRDDNNIELSNINTETDPQKLVDKISKKSSEVIIGKVGKILKTNDYEHALIVSIQGSSFKGFIPRYFASNYEYRKISDQYEVGDEVEISLIEFNEEHASFRCKCVNLINPWENVAFTENDIIEVTVCLIREQYVICEAECGVYGKLPVSQLSWSSREDNLNLINELNIGQQIEVKVLNADFLNKKIIFSKKQVEENPNITFHRSNLGKFFDGSVTKIHFSGINVKIDEFIKAFIPISEISKEYINDIEDVVQIGEKVTVKITGYDDLYENVVASIKQAIE